MPLMGLCILDTEIDWETYMIQTKIFLHGQHNYSLITGPTGPLVYDIFHSLDSDESHFDGVAILQVTFEYTNSCTI